MNVWWLILIGLVAISGVMKLLWFVQRRTGDAGIVDVGWTYGVGALAVFFAVTSTEGAVPRRVIVGILAALWSLRLGTYILLRTHAHAEDGRYRQMREAWGAHTQRNFFVFFQMQALAALLFSMPMLLASRSAAPLGFADYLGVAIWLVAACGETLADWQLARFRKDSKNHGQVCKAGLWRYSRHPNYFFEWLHWWAYVFLAVQSPWGWLAVLGPLVMLYFIVYVTGIPPTEAQAVRSRGDAYRAYQKTTSAFFPWPPKA